MCLIPSSVPSLRLTWVTSISWSLMESRSTQNPWFCACDLHFARPQVFHRVVGPAVPELQLVSPAAQGEPEELLSQADPEDGEFSQQFPDCVDSVSYGLGVPGAVREQYPVRLEGPDFGRACSGRDDGTAQPRSARHVEDVEFHPEIEHDNREDRLPLLPGEGVRAGHFPDQVAPDQAGRFLRLATVPQGPMSRVEIMPFIAPLTRRWRVRARVSIPSIPIYVVFFQVSARVIFERQLLGTGWYSLTMKPPHGSPLIRRPPG